MTGAFSALPAAEPSECNQVTPQNKTSARELVG